MNLSIFFSEFNIYIATHFLSMASYIHFLFIYYAWGTVDHLWRLCRFAQCLVISGVAWAI